MLNTVHFSLSKDGRTAFVAVKIGSTGKKLEFDVELPPPAGEPCAIEVDFNDEGLALALRHTTNLNVAFRNQAHSWGAVFGYYDDQGQVFGYLDDQSQLAAAAGDIEHGRVRDIQEVIDEHESDRT